MSQPDIKASDLEAALVAVEAAAARETKQARAEWHAGGNFTSTLLEGRAEGRLASVSLLRDLLLTPPAQPGPTTEGREARKEM